LVGAVLQIASGSMAASALSACSLTCSERSDHSIQIQFTRFHQPLDDGQIRIAPLSRYTDTGLAHECGRECK